MDPAPFVRLFSRYLRDRGLPVTQQREQIAEIVPGEAGTYEIVARDDDESRAPLSRRQARKLRELIPW